MKFIKYIFIVFVLAVISVFWFNDKETLSFERPIPLKFSENLREDIESFRSQAPIILEIWEVIKQRMEELLNGEKSIDLITFIP